MTTILNNIYWEPGIGDPSFFGWIIALLYLSVAYVSLLCGLREKGRGDDSSFSVLFWYLFAFLLFFLGANKQLDLQSLLIQIGRGIARYYGFYGQRREIQRIFVLVFAAFSIVTTGFLVKIMLHDFKKYSILFLGMFIVFLFILLRAASMSHIHVVPDTLRFVGGVRMRYVVEFCGIAVVGGGVLYCLKKHR